MGTCNIDQKAETMTDTSALPKNLKLPAPPPEPAGYDGDWTLIAERSYEGDPHQQTTDGIKSFTLTDGIWFVSGPNFVTAIPLTRWDYVTLTKDDAASHI